MIQKKGKQNPAASFHRAWHLDHKDKKRVAVLPATLCLKCLFNVSSARWTRLRQHLLYLFNHSAPVNVGSLTPLHYRDADTFYILPGASCILGYVIYVAGKNGILYHIPPERIIWSVRRPVILWSINTSSFALFHINLFTYPVPVIRI